MEQSVMYCISVVEIGSSLYHSYGLYLNVNGCNFITDIPVCYIFSTKRADDGVEFRAKLRYLSDSSLYVTNVPTYTITRADMNVLGALALETGYKNASGRTNAIQLN